MAAQDREGTFIPQEDAHKLGFWGTPVSEFPNDRFTVAGVAKLHVGGWAGSDEAPSKRGSATEAKDTKGGNR